MHERLKGPGAKSGGERESGDRETEKEMGRRREREREGEIDSAAKLVKRPEE